MPDIHHDAPIAERVSYSTRSKPETAGEILWNRISVTACLFATAMIAALTLGRKR